MRTSRRPAAVRLRRAYDATRLVQDLDALAAVVLQRQPGPYHSGGWRGLSLIAPGGRADWAGACAPAREAPGRTCVLAATPYFSSVLDGLSCEVESARLLALLPNERIGTHRDPMMNLGAGRIRLHLPIVTDAAVEFVVDGERYHLRPGELWYADFSKFHSVANPTARARVHLVMDVCVNEAILDLFPKASLEGEDPVDVHRVPPALTSSVLCLPPAVKQFALPAGVQKMVGAIRSDALAVASKINGAASVPREPLVRRLSFCHPDANPVLCLDGEPFSAIVPLSPTSFRIVGVAPCITGRLLDGAVGLFFKDWLVARCEENQGSPLDEGSVLSGRPEHQSTPL